MIECIENYLKTFKEKENMYVKKKVSIIGSPLSAGQPLGGVNLACDNLRMLGLHKVIDSLGWSYEDVGNVGTGGSVSSVGSTVGEDNDNSQNHIDINDHKGGGCMTKKCVQNNYYNNIKNVDIVGKFSEELFYAMSKELRKKNFVLNIGGDHSVAFPSILSALQFYPDLRVIWIDAHGDINIPETSPSGNYHGMALAHTIGLFKNRVPCFEWSENLTYLKPENVAIIGIRDIDIYEKIILKKCNINYYTIFDIEKNGIYNTICTALKLLDPHEEFPIHVSFDIDSVDSFFAPGTGTIAKGGLNYREINLLMKVLADTKRVVSMDLVEYNPSLDENDKKVHGDSLPISEYATKTGKLCLELIARVLGNDIV
ncbi:arginase, putative [Plasmodium knowlesi strain H]|uniref:arginase n=3 Tax=Plasmodium knowlesi TaxID=5850 RepID=A0A5K1UTW0_PLAKH|nr:arginase, putative [Plasmodium knowlesi strain H]OTN67413.1 putative Arginase [Plasmodium knowlesi]CAA9987333.1 arginase, putative [Plasmodium knowlesi strain H]SBO23385.1 arginase, putative [Plasmodium knowlesi strain H]SBO24613.1 arginase, putative [Plasmodium knowlesi strain H]VVS76807.1 arginase, putative [Plasmodium knowlesi strain H]|eukprot:XP_002258337.1 Arginase, putative [Plasmodium knowlesi strain H]